MDWSAYSLRKLWNTQKHHVAPWWADNSKEAYADGCARLAAALTNWSKARKSIRDDRAGFPQPSSRRGRQSVTFTTNFRVAGSHHVILPKLGRLKTFENTAKLASRIDAGTSRASRATLAFERGRWFVSFTVHEHIDDQHAKPHVVTSPVGIDLGVKDLLVVADSNGAELERVRAPRHLAEAQRRLRSLQRKLNRQVGPYDTVTKQQREPSAGWKRTQTRIARAHARVANLRENALHQATTHIAETYQHVVIEDLAVKAMAAHGGARKRGLNRAISDAAFGKLSWMLTYKTGWNGGTLTRADRWFPSSKTCSGCGAVKAKLTLAERNYMCDNCGARIDRDLNAATNLARLSGHPAGVPGRDASGAMRKTTAVAAGSEAGTHLGGSATPQEVAA